PSASQVLSSPNPKLVSSPNISTSSPSKITMYARSFTLLVLTALAVHDRGLRCPHLQSREEKVLFHRELLRPPLPEPYERHPRRAV
ncbi:hypothetical protein CPC16_005432, partial [Podila verticillata]